jgi:hypothetical protein
MSTGQVFATPRRPDLDLAIDEGGAYGPSPAASTAPKVQHPPSPLAWATSWMGEQGPAPLREGHVSQRLDKIRKADRLRVPSAKSQGQSIMLSIYCLNPQGGGVVGEQ